jgi:hypothetical protein
VFAEDTNFGLSLVAKDLDNTNGMTQVRNFGWPLVIFFKVWIVIRKTSSQSLANLSLGTDLHPQNEVFGNLCLGRGPTPLSLGVWVFVFGFLLCSESLIFVGGL